MKAIHFGAGNIGRGFIGLILRQNGYELTFADISDTLIDEIKAKGEYNVIIADTTGRIIHVDGVDAVHNVKEVDRLKVLLQEADLITTAVGPAIVPIIARTITDGIKLRLAQPSVKPLNIIACENAIGATGILKETLYRNLSEDEQKTADQAIGFPNSAVDRIVPAQSNQNLLDVKVEPFFEWVIEADKLKGSPPRIEGVHYVDNLQPYIERKLFTVNTGHAATAYLGMEKGFTTVSDAINNPEIEAAVRGVLAETAKYITGFYGFDVKEQQEYVDTILSRFKNPDISDDLARVGRSPLRKISRSDRFVNPALRLMDMGIEPKNLANALAAALKFCSESDKESLELSAFVQSHGVRATLVKYSSLAADSKLIDLVEKAYSA